MPRRKLELGLVTPDDTGKTLAQEESLRKQPLTFGSFLPPMFTIAEEKEESIAGELAQQRCMDPNIVAMQVKDELAGRCLSYSDTESSRNPTPMPAVRGNRSSQMGKPLAFVPPAHRSGKVVVKIEQNDIAEQENYWQTALIGFVVGDTPYQKSMEHYVAYTWDFVGKPQVFLHDEGYYLFKFATKEECDLVLQAGPYTYQNKPLILQYWAMDFIFDPAYLTKIPLWITLPGLPVGYWSAEALSKVASAVGRPLYTDRFTASMAKISYARILVEVDVAQPLLDSIELETPYGSFTQAICYEWIPKFCNECLKFGHETEKCWVREQKEEELRSPQRRRKRRNRRRRAQAQHAWQIVGGKGTEEVNAEPKQTGVNEMEKVAQQDQQLHTEGPVVLQEQPVHNKQEAVRQVEQLHTKEQMENEQHSKQQCQSGMRSSNRFAALSVEEGECTGGEGATEYFPP